jgi:O-antigen/teichoic acid export membrane protein
MHDVGIYSFSIKIVRLFLLIFDSIFVVLTPVLAFKLAQKYEISDINHTFNVLISNLFGLFLPLCFLIFIFSDSIVFFLGGEKFLESALILKLLMPMAFFYIYSSIIGSQVLYNIGQLSIVRNILLVVLLISLLFGVIFVKNMKLFGIVLTINLSFFLLTVCYYISAIKSINGIKLFSLQYIYKYLFASAFPYLIYIIAFNSIPYNNIILNVFFAVLYAISYLIILFLLKEEHLINSVNKIFITKKNV